MTAGSWILDTLPQSAIASSPPDNSGNVLATPARDSFVAQIGDEGLVAERERDARDTEEDAAPGVAQDVLVLNSRVTDLEGASRMLAKQVQDMATESLVNDPKTLDDLAVSQIATNRS